MKRITYSIAAVICIVLVCSFQAGHRFALFVLGDSISLQYGTHLERILGSEVQIQRKGSQENAMKNLDVPVDANGGDSRMVLSYLASRKNDVSFKPDLMLLNCGMHDIKRNPATNAIAVDTAEYRSNLEAIYTLLAEKQIPVIWVTTTGLIDSIHAAKSKAFNRYEKDVTVYNRIADDVCKKRRIPEIDLFNFTWKQGDDRYADHAHFIPRVQVLQAQLIADYVKEWRKQNNK